MTAEIQAPAETQFSSISQIAGGELKTLARHSSHYLAGLLGNLALGLVSFPIFTRLFSVAEYGLMDLAQRVVLMLTIASKAGLQNAVLRFYDKDQFGRNPESARTYYSTMLLGTFSIAVCVGMGFIAVSSILPESVWSGPLAKLTYVIAGLAMLRALGAIVWGFLRIEERTKAFNAVTVGTRGATIAAVCALLPWAGRTARTYLIGSVVVETVLIATLTLWLMRRNLLAVSRVDGGMFRAGIVFGLPLVVYELAFAVLGSADRFLVRSYLGADALGFYSVAYGIAQHANEILVAPLGLAILPIYMRLWASQGSEKTSEFLTIALDFFVMGAAGILAMVGAAASPLIILLASSKYAGGDHLIPLILGGLLIYATYIFVAAGLLIHKRTAEMAGLLVFAAVINIGLNCLMLPRLGLTGSAVATLLSYALCIFLLGRSSNRFLHLRFSGRSLMKYAAAAAAAWIVGTQVELGAPVLNLLGKGGTALSCYVAALYTVDGRVRHAARWVAVQCKGQI
ncbi:MAG TPA: oligosaccharide flippase family protein [Bryobacteraceae bacterium]|nr:oligosaccharide flippase family protein [Bryobacteraceae bacterium]